MRDCARRLRQGFLAALVLAAATAGCVGGGDGGSNDLMASGDPGGGGAKDAWSSGDPGAGPADLAADPGSGPHDTAVARDEGSAPSDAWAPSDLPAADAGYADWGPAEDPGAWDAWQPPEPQPGQITAAEWDDNLNFEAFRDYVDGAIQSWPGMAFLPVGDRVVIRVSGADGVAASGARVEVLADGEAVLDAPVRPDGRLILFPAREGLSGTGGLTLRVTPVGADGPAFEGPLEVAGGHASVTLPSPGVRPVTLDLAFVVDVTGSMSDELEFLKSEIADIVDAIGAEGQQVSIRYGLVVYRDQGDDFVTRAFDFTADLQAFRTNLGAQRADGGGDYEEAVHQGLEKMNGLSWRPGNVARVAFHVADAPPHDADSGAFLEQVEAARRRGIAIYPVAASGVAEAAEYLMRMAAQSTLARYVFITDDSGIGGGHSEPQVAKDCMQVQYLNGLLKRLLRSELAGSYIPPTANEILREAGNPVDGVCTFQDGTTLVLW